MPVGTEECSECLVGRTGETRTRVPVLAPTDGIVTRMMAREGMYVTKDTEMFTIADLSRVWVMVDVFERQLAMLKPNMFAEVVIYE